MPNNKVLIPLNQSELSQKILGTGHIALHIGGFESGSRALRKLRRKVEGGKSPGSDCEKMLRYLKPKHLYRSSR